MLTRNRKPGYRRLVGTLMAGGDAKSVEVAPGATAEASRVLKPALCCKGIVVDEQGKPIPAVEKRIGNVREFVDRILAETAGRGGDEFSVRVVYSSSTVEFDGSRTAQMRLAKGDREPLRAPYDQLTPEE